MSETPEIERESIEREAKALEGLKIKAEDLHAGDKATRSAIARALGSIHSDERIKNARALAESRKGTKWTEEQKENLRARRAELREEKIAAGILQPKTPSEPKKMGRPPKPKPEGADLPTEPKKRGRPSKRQTDGQTIEGDGRE